MALKLRVQKIDLTDGTSGTWFALMATFKPAGGGTPASWTISGTITPSSGGANATVSLSGPANATTTSDGSGNYAFAGLADGTYTVTPSNSGYSFSPSMQTVPLVGATNPDRTLSNVVLPAPFGPMSPTTAASRRTLNPSMGRTPPNCTTRSLISIM